MKPTEGSGNRLLRKIEARNILSFGAEGISVPLQPLNVLIGPNGCGKSNFLELLALLRAAPTDVTVPMINGGGVREWIWKGARGSTSAVEALVGIPPGDRALRHVIEFREVAQKFELMSERVEEDSEGRFPMFQDSVLYRFEGSRAFVRRRDRSQREIDALELAFRSFSDHSVLSELKDPAEYPELTHLGHFYERVRAYREWSFGRSTVFREPQKADLRTDRLEDDFSNLAMFLNKLRRHPRSKAALLKRLCDLYEGLTDFDLSVEGGTVQIFFAEGDFTIPATRLSDGSLRYLCLLAILLDPDPPPLICIEEPELGLHPDLHHKLADLLVEASERCQLIVTTHSDILVDALTDYPDSVVVCEKHNGQTTMERLKPEELSVWLEKYRLGELWTSGQLGGTRW